MVSANDSKVVCRKALTSREVPAKQAALRCGRLRRPLYVVGIAGGAVLVRLRADRVADTCRQESRRLAEAHLVLQQRHTHN